MSRRKTWISMFLALVAFWSLLILGIITAVGKYDIEFEWYGTGAAVCLLAVLGLFGKAVQLCWAMRRVKVAK